MTENQIKPMIQLEDIFGLISIEINDTVLYAILAASILFFLIISITIVYHLRKFSVGKKGRIISEIIYFSVSIILILLMFLIINVY